MLRAARDNDVQVIWDLCHYGWPDDITIWSPSFVERFAAFASAAAKVVQNETDGPPLYCPVNEMSFWAWAGGEVGLFNPSCYGRGGDLKRQLVRSTIAAISAIRSVDRRARFISAEPLINVVCGSPVPEHIEASETYRLSQFEAMDMLAGTLEPELGGSPGFVDIVGLNFYPDNQWYHCGPTIPMGHHAYRPLHDLLIEVHERYGRPILMAETGAEGSGRPAWLHYVSSEVHTAIEAGVPVLGMCLYPILDYPGWENERNCHVGLFSPADWTGQRTVCKRFAEELRRQQGILAGFDGQRHGHAIPWLVAANEG
jgi:hypothetical protein